MRSFLPPRRLLATALAAATAVVAGLSGGATTSAMAAACPPPPTPVAAFPDEDQTGYVMTTGGAFGAGSPAWTLSGGATRVAADQAPDPFAPAFSTGALYLPPGSSATSPCVTAPGIIGLVRMYAKSVGAPGGQLSVQVIVHGTVYSAGIITAGTGWAATRPLASDAPWYKGAVAYQVRLAPVGPGASFAVDDVWIDPLMHR